MLSILDDEIREGAVIPGGYRLDRIVGEGGTAIVWSAHREEEKFALKFLKDERSADAKSHERLLREARAASAIDHPNVARVIDVLELENGIPYVVMELLEGETLGARLRRAGRLSLEETKRIFIAVIDAVSAAHAQGIVHRDLKPDNVFLVKGQDETVKVLDFGIAKHLSPGTDASLTTTGAMVGTPCYMAPEQIFGDRIDASADVWAIGIMMYECLAGRRPTQAVGVGQVLKIVAFGTIPSLAVTAPEIPAQVRRVVERALSSKASARPSLEEIRAALAGETSRSRLPVIVPAVAVMMLLIGGIVFARVKPTPRAVDPPRPETTAAPAPTRQPEAAASTIRAWEGETVASTSEPVLIKPQPALAKPREIVATATALSCGGGKPQIPFCEGGIDCNQERLQRSKVTCACTLHRSSKPALRGQWDTSRRLLSAGYLRGWDSRLPSGRDQRHQDQRET